MHHLVSQKSAMCVTVNYIVALFVHCSSFGWVDAFGWVDVYHLLGACRAQQSCIQWGINGSSDLSLDELLSPGFWAAPPSVKLRALVIFVGFLKLLQK